MLVTVQNHTKYTPVLSICDWEGIVFMLEHSHCCEIVTIVLEIGALYGGPITSKEKIIMNCDFSFLQAFYTKFISQCYWAIVGTIVKKHETTQYIMDIKI